MSQANQEVSISSTSATSPSPNCLFTCARDESQSGENVEQSSTSLVLADPGPVSPCPVLQSVSAPFTGQTLFVFPKQEDPRFPSKVQHMAVTAHLFIACTC
ncbi:unnamed protein product [Pleuronectes platessa]|uniref:Uncharacterized protein n=1 Tax=Pleuronectes platessa TaxID=8262 RepID=A0A9N7U5E6_PLEPL|nr:unnamed protein product [Pleuronectes platessa]